MESVVWIENCREINQLNIYNTRSQVNEKKTEMVENLLSHEIDKVFVIFETCSCTCSYVAKKGKYRSVCLSWQCDQSLRVVHNHLKMLLNIYFCTKR